MQGTAGAAFDALWAALVEVLGGATTVTLLRRSAKHAAARHPALAALQIVRHDFEYSYTVPPGWRESSEAAKEAIEALRELLTELCAVLVPLTGRVVVRRLEKLPELQHCGLLVCEVCP